MSGVRQQAGFVQASVGRRFRLVSEPSDRPPIGTVVCVHAFAEEMNKSRRMGARLARLLAAAGWRVVQRDLFGCGDSTGDFADASWAAWTEDIDAESRAADPRHPLWVWCVRAGALLAPAALAARPDANLLLWQPVVSGAQHLQQFLRLHAGARIVGSDKSGSATSPAQRLRAGAAVELGGYELSPALAAGLEQSRFDVPDGFGGRIVWFELSLDEPAQASPAALRLQGQLHERRIVVELEALTGPAFWQTQEIEECDALLRRSVAALVAPAVSTSGGAA